MIQIRNNGPEILSTNFWDSPANRKGIVVVSLNAGTFRLLLPDALGEMVDEMATGKEVVIAKGLVRGLRAYSFLFDDGTDNPFLLRVGENQFGGVVPADGEHGKAVRVSAWVRGPRKVLDLPGRFCVRGRRAGASADLIRRAGLEGCVDQERTYPEMLAPELEVAYCYTLDGGHSVIVVLENEYIEGTPVEDWLVPAPVRAVLRAGYTVRDGLVWCRLPYSPEIGLLIEDNDEEF